VQIDPIGLLESDKKTPIPSVVRNPTPPKNVPLLATLALQPWLFILIILSLLTIGSTNRLPALKLWPPLSLQCIIRLSHYRCHSQRSRFWTCHVNISTNCFLLKAKQLQQCLCLLRQNGQIALHIYNLITVIQDFGFNRIFNLKWSLFGLDFEIKLLDQIWIWKT